MVHMVYNTFHTFGEYIKRNGDELTPSMEDYLEMIYRLSQPTGFLRIHELSEALNVQPPSATKMVQRLKELDFIKYEKYGFIMLEPKGLITGKALLERHNRIEALLTILGVPKELLLSETEKLEHLMSCETIACIERFIHFVSLNPDVATRLAEYKRSTE